MNFLERISNWIVDLIIKLKTKDMDQQSVHGYNDIIDEMDASYEQTNNGLVYMSGSGLIGSTGQAGISGCIGSSTTPSSSGGCLADPVNHWSHSENEEYRRYIERMQRAALTARQGRDVIEQIRQPVPEYPGEVRVEYSTGTIERRGSDGRPKTEEVHVGNKNGNFVNEGRVFNFK